MNFYYNWEKEGYFFVLFFSTEIKQYNVQWEFSQKEQKKKKTNQIVCKRIREASKQLKKRISFQILSFLLILHLCYDGINPTTKYFFPGKHVSSSRFFSFASISVPLLLTFSLPCFPCYIIL